MCARPPPFFRPRSSTSTTKVVAAPAMAFEQRSERAREGQPARDRQSLEPEPERARIEGPQGTSLRTENKRTEKSRNANPPPMT